MRWMWIALLLVGCKEKADPVVAPKETGAAPAAPTGWYLVTIDASSAPLPFFLKVSKDCADGATVLNGPEAIDVQCTKDENAIHVSFPAFDAAIDVNLDYAGSFRGEWTMGPVEGRKKFPVIGRPIDRPDPTNRFVATSPPAVNVTGDWRIDSQLLGVARGNFTQAENGAVEGGVMLEGRGDVSYLSGLVRGNELQLSTFNGHVAILLQAKIEGDRMTGMLVRPGLLYENFTATRGEVEIDYLHQVKLKEGKKRLTLPALEKYAGKPVLVDLFGTWCTNCIDMVPFLREMKQKHTGLEILGVAVELVEDRAYAEQQVKRYRERHGIDWEIEIVLGDAEKLSDLLPPELAGIEGVPISVLVERDGTVHAVHTAFAGPATGAEHQRVRAELERLIQEIL